MKLIESKTLGTAQASIEFTSIPSTFTDLVVLASLRPATGGIGYGLIALNGSTANFSGRTLEGNGSAASSNSFSVGRIMVAGDSGYTANTFGNGLIYIPNYTSSNAKSLSSDWVTENNATGSYQNIFATLWNNTAAITSLSLSPAAAVNWAVGSTVSLYGVLKGSDGIVTTSP
jgi:hypothetical protein